MKFYHWTTEDNWIKIQQCGYLNPGTYFAPTPWLWKHPSYGDVLLEIEYTPLRQDFGTRLKGGGHNYGFDPPPGQFCVQFNIFKRISLDTIKRVRNLDELSYLKDMKPQVT
jgi:hypothetical protein